MKTKEEVRKVEELRSRGAEGQDPTESLALRPQAGCARLTPPLLDFSIYRLQNRGNKARMSMKTKSRGVVKPEQEVRRVDAYGLSLFDFQLSTLNRLTRIRRNKARMSMKTKSRGVEKSRSSGVKAKSRRIGPDTDSLSLFDCQLSTARLEFVGTKREYL
jgi:hypothetical protein